EGGFGLFASLGLTGAASEKRKSQNPKPKTQKKRKSQIPKSHSYSPGYSPGRLRILPNSLSSGSISMTPGIGFGGETRSVFPAALPVLGSAAIEGCGKGGRAGASLDSESGGSAEGSPMNQFLRLSSQLR